jgi:hypothetical protein
MTQTHRNLVEDANILFYMLGDAEIRELDVCQRGIARLVRVKDNL